jgi:hypothetical protein
LKKLMVDAKLDPAFQNYRLDGVQTTFMKRDGKLTLLGNSIIEGDNAHVPLDQASCITCHSASAIARDGGDGIHILKGNPVGSEVILPPNYSPRDFAWSLFLAPKGSSQPVRSSRKTP